jgi:hypothetical protein
MIVCDMCKTENEGHCKKCGQTGDVSSSAVPAGYVEIGLLVAEPYEDTYPRFFKLKDHFGAVSLKLEMEENGCKDVEILPVYIKLST